MKQRYSRLIYASRGTLIKTPGFEEILMKAFPVDSSIMVIYQGVTSSEWKAPTNIINIDWVNQVKILEIVDVFITHCGMNSVHEALFLGVPLIGIPYHADQHANASSIKENRLGKVINCDDLAPELLAQAAKEIFSNYEQYTKNVKAMAKTFQNGSEGAYKIVTGVLEGPDEDEIKQCD